MTDHIQMACARCYLSANGVPGFFPEAVTVYSGEALCAQHLREAAGDDNAQVPR
jgi:hypothetical protein